MTALCADGDYKDKSQGFSFRIVKTNDSVMRIYTLTLKLKIAFSTQIK